MRVYYWFHSNSDIPSQSTLSGLLRCSLGSGYVHCQCHKRRCFDLRTTKRKQLETTQGFSKDRQGMKVHALHAQMKVTR